MSEKKKFVLSIELCEHTENENNDVIFLKKTYETCKGKHKLLACLPRHNKIIKKYIEEEI